MNIAMPETLQMTAELTQEYPKTASTYKAVLHPIEEETFTRLFLSAEPDVRQDIAQGVHLEAHEEQMDEVVNLYLPPFDYPWGASYGKGLFTADGEDLTLDWANQLDCLDVNDTPDQAAQNLGMMQMQSYDAEQDLAFATQEEVKTDAEQKMAECGLTDLELESILPMDTKTLNINRSIYNEALESAYKYAVQTYGEENVIGYDQYMEGKKKRKFTSADERYFLRYRQMIDQIPVNVESWVGLRDDNSYDLTQTIAFEYCATGGLLGADFFGYYDLRETVSEDALLSPEEAVKIYTEEYGKRIHFTSTTIQKVELRYVAVVHQDEIYLKPAWLLWTATESEDSVNEVTMEPVIEYEITVVNAVSGVILENDLDMR